MRSRVLVPLLLTFVITGLLAQTAQAQGPYGSSLAAPANYPFHCDARWTPGWESQAGAFGPGGQQEWVPWMTGPSTCTVFNTGAGYAHGVPGAGKVTVARIKSGANPAPVSISTIRLYQGRRPSDNQLVTTCCRGISETAVVQPTPNAITEIPVNLIVAQKDFNPDDNSAGYQDIVAVSAHGSTGTLPMAVVGPRPIIAPANDPGATWFYPRIGPDQDNINQWIASGFEVLMNFDWCPQAGSRATTRQACQVVGGPVLPGPTDPTGTPGTPGPRAEVRSTRLTLKGRTVAVQAKCTQATPCKVTMRLRTRGKKARTLGSKKQTIAAGRSEKVSVRLGKKNRKRVTRKGIKVTAVIDLGGGVKVTRKLTLKRAR